MPIRGETIGTAYVRVLADGSELDDDLERQMEGAGHKSGKAFNDAWTEELRKGLDEQEKLRVDREKAIQQKLVNQQRGFRSQLTKTSKQIGQILDQNDDWLQSTIETRKSLKSLENELNRGFHTMIRWGDELDSFETRWERIRVKVNRTFDADRTGPLIKRLETADRWLQKNSRSWDDLGDAVGRSFGKGARNNFLNIVGRIIGSLAALPALLADAGSGIVNFGKKVLTAFQEGGGGVGGMVAALQALLQPIGLAALGIAGLTLIVGTLTSAVLLAGGAVLALAASLSAALVGAIGVAALALVPLVAGVGVAIAGFASMDKAAKEAFGGIKDSFKDLGDTAAGELFKNAADDAKALEGVIKGLNPLVKVLAEAVRDVGEGWIEGLQSAGFKEFQTNLTKTLPDMIRSLGQIAANVGEVLANIWIVASPHVQDFLGWLTGVTGELADLGTAPGGRLDTFFDGLAESVQAVSHFLGEAVDLLGVFFSAGKGTGDQLFREIGDQLGEWADHLRENPQILEDFFHDAKRLAEALGNAVVQAGKLIDALDTPGSRDFAVGAIKAIEQLIKAITTVVTWVNELDDGLGTLAFTIGSVALAFPKLTNGFLNIVGGLAGIGRKADETSGKIGGLSTKMRGLAGVAGVGLLIDGLSDAENSFSIFEDTLGGAAIGLSVGGPWGAAIGAAAGLVVGLTQKFDSTGMAAADAYREIAKVDSVEKANDSFQDLASTLDQVTGAYTAETRAGALKKLQDAGLVSEADKLGIKTRTLLNAAMGMKGAWQEITPLTHNLKDGIKADSDAMSDLVSNADNWKDGRLTDEARAQLRAFGEHKKGLQDDLAVLQRMSPELREMARNMRESSAVTADYTGKLKGIPKDIKSKIEAVGIIPTTRGVAEIANRFKRLQNVKSIKTLIAASGADTTVKAVQRVIKKMQEADRQKAQPEVVPKVSKAEAAIAKIQGALKKIDIFNVFPEADLKKDKFDSKAGDAKRKADELGRMSPTVHVGADTDQASSNLTGIKTQVDNLPTSKTITITTVHKTVRAATGGIFASPTNVLLGEAGPEAVVPLSRPLSQVDPAVRELSAIAQGLSTATLDRTLTVRSNDQRPIELTVVTPTEDPFAVAVETINRLTAVGYS